MIRYFSSKPGRSRARTEHRGKPCRRHLRGRAQFVDEGPLTGATSSRPRSGACSEAVERSPSSRIKREAADAQREITDAFEGNEEIEALGSRSALISTTVSLRSVMARAMSSSLTSGGKPQLGAGGRHCWSRYVSRHQGGQFRPARCFLTALPRKSLMRRCHR